MNASVPIDFPEAPSPEIGELVERLCHGTIAPSEAIRLEQVVIDDAKARRFYVRYLQMHAALPWLSGARSTMELRGINRSESEPKLPPKQITGNLKPFAFGQALRSRLAATRLLVGVVAILFYGSFFLLAWNLRPESIRCDIATSTSVPVVATLTAVEECLVGSGTNKNRLRVGEQLQADELFDLISGTAELTFTGGARVILAGPTRFTARTAGSSYLHSGKLVATVPRRAVGFEVITPTATIVDLGTEFGVEVSDHETTEVQVLAGKVQVVQEMPNRAPLKAQLTAGQAMLLGQDQSAVSIPANPTKFRRHRFLVSDRRHDDEAPRQRWETLLNDPDLAARFVCGQQPEHRDRLISLADRANSPVGTLMNGTSSGDGKWYGPRWTATPDRRGFGVTSKALWFNGEKDHVAFGHFDFGQQFTFAAWIYPLKSPKPAILVNNMDFDGDKSGFYLALNQNTDPTLPNACGDLLFAVHDGEDRRYFARSAPDCIQYEQWQHVTLTVNAADRTARIYRNGIEVANGKAGPEKFQIYTTGKWNLGCEDLGAFAFLGLVDEVTIFHRILSAQEIADLAH